MINTLFKDVKFCFDMRNLWAQTLLLWSKIDWDIPDNKQQLIDELNWYKISGEILCWKNCLGWDFPGTNFVLRTQCCNGTYLSYSCGMEIVNLKELVCLAKVKRRYTVTCKKWESFAYDLLINDRRALVKYGRTWIEDGLFPHAGKFCENLSNNTTQWQKKTDYFILIPTV